MERVGIERPSARPPGERAFEDGAYVVMHPTGAIDVRVSREDEVDASVLMGLEQSPFDAQPNPSFHRVRFLRMVFRDEPRSRAAVDVHVAGTDRVAPAASAAASAFSARIGTTRGHSGYGTVAACTTTSMPRTASTTDSRERRSTGITSVPTGNPAVPRPGRTTARTWWPARRARRTTAPPINPLAPGIAIRMRLGPSRPLKRMTPSRGATRLRARCMHEPGLCRPCDRRRKARLGAADAG